MMQARGSEMSPPSDVPSNGFQCILKPENTLFLVQVIAILIVVVASITNLSLHTGNQELWTMMLTASLGYLMPNPKFRAGQQPIEKVKEPQHEPTSL